MDRPSAEPGLLGHLVLGVRRIAPPAPARHRLVAPHLPELATVGRRRGLSVDPTTRPRIDPALLAAVHPGSARSRVVAAMLPSPGREPAVPLTVA